MLARVAFDVSTSDLEAQVERLARVLLSSREEQKWAVAAVSSALSHPLMHAVAKADEVRRETALTHVRPDGVLIEGVIDLAFRAGGVWHVVEFKTDDSLERHREQYETQVRAYIAAIAAATGLPTKGTLFLV